MQSLYRYFRAKVYTIWVHRDEPLRRLLGSSVSMVLTRLTDEGLKWSGRWYLSRFRLSLGTLNTSHALPTLHFRGLGP